MQHTSEPSKPSTSWPMPFQTKRRDPCRATKSYCINKLIQSRLTLSKHHRFASRNWSLFSQVVRSNFSHTIPRYHYSLWRRKTKKEQILPCCRPLWSILLRTITLGRWSTFFLAFIIWMHLTGPSPHQVLSTSLFFVLHHFCWSCPQALLFPCLKITVHSTTKVTWSWRPELYIEVCL